MKKIFFFLGMVLALTTQSAAAASDVKTPDVISIKINMIYRTQNKHGQLVQRTLQNTYELETHADHWTTLGAVNPTLPQVLLLQGKVIGTTAETATLQFLAFDLNDQSNTVLSPKIVVRYGQKGKIHVQENYHNLQLALTANTSNNPAR